MAVGSSCLLEREYAPAPVLPPGRPRCLSTKLGHPTFGVEGRRLPMDSLDPPLCSSLCDRP